MSILSTTFTVLHWANILVPGVTLIIDCDCRVSVIGIIQTVAGRHCQHLGNWDSEGVYSHSESRINHGMT